jgi:hypothetical protein
MPAPQAGLVTCTSSAWAGSELRSSTNVSCAYDREEATFTSDDVGSSRTVGLLVAAATSCKAATRAQWEDSFSVYDRRGPYANRGID